MCVLSLQLFPTLIVNIAAISVGLGYGLNSVIVAQLKSHSENLTSSFTHVMDDGATGWIGKIGLCLFSHRLT